MRDPVDHMWGEAIALLARADQLRQQFFRIGSGAGGRVWEPPADIVETELELRVIVALPGVRPDSVRIGLDGSELSIVAQRAAPLATRAMLVRRMEIPYGRFERRIGLPLSAPRLVEQELRDGCLVLIFAK